ncbi:MAG: DUF1772 domain-containing protein [Myxococcota bacterium]
MSLLIATAATGAGLVTGLLFAFSNFVMRALAELPSKSAMRAMQRINVKIINPIFLLLFLGTPALCAGIVLDGSLRSDSSVDPIALLGALAYLVGPFGITLAFNVPLNNQLAAHDPSTSDSIWLDYQRRWQFWNHIRTCIGIVATALLAGASSAS